MPYAGDDGGGNESLSESYKWPRCGAAGSTVCSAGDDDCRRRRRTSSTAAASASSSTTPIGTAIAIGSQSGGDDALGTAVTAELSLAASLATTADDEPTATAAVDWELWSTVDGRVKCV